MSVALFCPVRERPDVLDLALEAHRKLEGVSVLWYADDNSDPASSKLLHEAAWGKLDYILGRVSEKHYGISAYSGHNWSVGSMSRLGRIRQWALDRFLEWGGDHLLMIDADVIPHPDTVSHLVSLQKPVVSAVYWSQWPVPGICACGHSESEHDFAEKIPDCLYCDECQGYAEGRSPWLPNCWFSHNYGFSSPDSILGLADPVTREVGGLGAITLISRDAVERGASYRPVLGIEYPGEDRHFAIRCAVRNVALWADSFYPPFHVYRPEEQLEEAERWYRGGASPLYFREKWLTPPWEQAIRRMLPPASEASPAAPR